MGKAAQRRQRPIEGKESYKWLKTMQNASKGQPEDVRYIHIADREGDVCAFFAKAEKEGQTFLTRFIHPRRVSVGTEKERKIQSIQKFMKSQEVQGHMTIQVPRNSHQKQKEREAVLQVKFSQVQLLKSRNSKDNVPESLTLYAISAEEVNPPVGMKAVSWHLISNFEVLDIQTALRVIGWYVQRWKTERFHYVLKSGCQVKKLQKSTIEKLEKLTLVYSIVALRLLWMLTLTLSRENPNLLCTVCFDDEEWKILYCFIKKTKVLPPQPPTLREAVLMVAKLHGFAGRPSDGKLGAKVLWSGLRDLQIMVSARFSVIDLWVKGRPESRGLRGSIWSVFSLLL